MSRIPDDVLDSIRQATDIVELVGRYVPLQRSGHDFKARCPFHQEKTPSFYVVPDKEMWTCFGCHKGGNVFSFLMEREGLTFLEAVRQLAGAAGITIDSTASPEAAAQASRLGRLREVCDWACRRFQAGLRWKEGARAREYLKGRGMTGETANLFRLGYAPAGWDNLLGAASREGIGEQDLLDAGLVIARDGGRGGSYDRFRDRVVFPIQDAQGRVIAFGARTLADEEPKYLNSPETPLFTKGRHLYALHLAKKEMLRTGEGAVMEGYTDVILTHQAGWPVAVAGLGTALTREQAALASRYVKKLYLVYDGDAAGLRAAERAIPEFLPEAIETRVAVGRGAAAGRAPGRLGGARRPPGAPRGSLAPPRRVRPPARRPRRGSRRVHRARPRASRAGRAAGARRGPGRPAARAVPQAARRGVLRARERARGHAAADPGEGDAREPRTRDGRR